MGLISKLFKNQNQINDQRREIMGTTYTLKEILDNYELPIHVRKDTWWGDFYFKISGEPVGSKVKGIRYKGGSIYDHQEYSIYERFELCHVNTLKEGQLFFPDKEANLIESLENYNKLNLDKKNYRKDITTLYVIKDGSAIKKGVFQKFETKKGQDFIYLLIDGKVGSYYFPNTQYIFPNKDDAIKSLSEKNKSKVGTTVRNIINAYRELPSAVETPEDYDEALEEEKNYHKEVDKKLSSDISEFTTKKDTAEKGITNAKYGWVDTYAENKNSPFSKKASFMDDHLFLSGQRKVQEYTLEKDAANKQIAELTQTKRKPYFARVDCGSNQFDLHTAYIGDADIEGYVVHWGNPEIGNVYYNSSILQSDSSLVIALKRLINIELGVFDSFEDEINLYGGEVTSSAEIKENSDAMLIKLLKDSRKNKKVHDIIRSIQTEQYRIITSDFDSDIVVNGCAGSGKTMIMYHRLSYIAYNYKTQTQNEFEPETVYVITPSTFFDSLNIELLKKLKLDGINNAPLAKHISRFLCETTLQGDLLPDLFTLNDSVKEPIDHNILERNYEYLSEKFDDLNENVMSNTKFLLWFYKNMNLMLKKCGFESIDFFELGEDSSWITEILNTDKYYHHKCFDSLKDIYENNIKEIFSRTTYENLLEALDEMEDGSSRKKERLLKLEKYEHLIKACLGKSVERDSNNGRVSSNVHGFWNLFDSTRNLERALTLIFIEKYVAQIINEDEESLNIIKFNYIIGRYCKEIPRHESNLLLSRWLMDTYYKASETFNSSFVFIDEYQNYSKFELKCISEIFGVNQPAYNLYGDFDQKISTNGISSIEEIKDILLEPEIYPITINYRNAKDITRYINKRTNKNMQSIGISGKVTEIVASECDFSIIDRTAVVCKDVKKVQEILELRLDKEKINDTSSNRTIKENVVNIILVEDCKGLEFDTVYVFDEGMTNNELYVALTRALNNLIVVTDDLS